jgi:hypothetical protein
MTLLVEHSTEHSTADDSNVEQLIVDSPVDSGASEHEFFAGMTFADVETFDDGNSLETPAPQAGLTVQEMIVDTAASSHMKRTLEGMYALEAVNTKVRLADGSTIAITLKGRVKLCLLDSRGRPVVLELQNVLHVPSLSRSLFSVPSFLLHRGNSVTFLPDRIVFTIAYNIVASIPTNDFDNIIHANAVSSDSESEPHTTNNSNTEDFNDDTHDTTTLEPPLTPDPVTHDYIVTGTTTSTSTTDQQQHTCLNATTPPPVIRKSTVDVDLLHK